MTILKNLQPSGFWLVMISAILWGTIGVATQGIYSLDNTTSLFINLARTVLASPILIWACWKTLGWDSFKFKRRDFFITLLSGALLALSHACYFIAIRYAGVTIATLLTICLAPLVVMGLSVLLKLEKLSKLSLFALFLALLGTILLLGFHQAENQQADFMQGVLFSLVAAVSFGMVILCGRFLANYHPLQISSWSFISGSVVLLIANLLTGIVIVQTVESWMLLLYLALVPTALAYWLLQMGLRTVSASTASIIGLIDPLVAALLAWFFFGESLGLNSLIGAGMLLGSIYLLSLRQD